jgi:hypothetical protein
MRLTRQLPGPAKLATLVSTIWKKPANEKGPREKLACKENIFLYHFALPEIFAALSEIMSVEEARQCIRCEYFRKFPEFSSGNAFRTSSHPFPKSAKNTSTHELLNKWRSKPTFPIYQAFPDLALSEPLPYRMVFDAKYFEIESEAAAEEALVSVIFEAFYYRGLPADNASSNGSPWPFEYACLLAYDSTAGGYLKKVWESVACKSSFWDDANIYVMVVRGEVRG